MDVELLVNALEMHAHRFDAQAQPIGYFLVREPFREQLENLIFALAARMAFDNAELVRIGIRAPIPAALSYSRRWKSESPERLRRPST